MRIPLSGFIDHATSWSSCCCTLLQAAGGRLPRHYLTQAFGQPFRLLVPDGRCGSPVPRAPSPRRTAHAEPAGLLDRFAFGLVARLLVVLTGASRPASLCTCSTTRAGLALAFGDMASTLNRSAGLVDDPVTLTSR